MIKIEENLIIPCPWIRKIKEEKEKKIEKQVTDHEIKMRTPCHRR